MNRIQIAMNVLERDMLVEPAATMLRKGATAEEVCSALRISDTALRKMASTHGFRYPVRPYKMWPAPDDPGEVGRCPSAYDNWRRAVAGAKATKQAMGI